MDNASFTVPTETVLEPFIREAFIGYATSMLWTCTGEGDEPLDALYDCDDFAESACIEMQEDIRDFIIAQWDDVRDLGACQVGHDFLLTRNGHGTGFWDRGLGERGDRLTAACRPYGESDAYVGDDGMVYVS